MTLHRPAEPHVVKAKMPGNPPSKAATDVLIAQAFRDIVAERVEQIDVHHFTREHDLGHDPEELACAAESYLAAAIDQLRGAELRPSVSPRTWPWERVAWRPGDARANLVKAIAIAWAVVDRLDAAPPAPMLLNQSGEAS